jgi:hypothetical protein
MKRPKRPWRDPVEALFAEAEQRRDPALWGLDKAALTGLASNDDVVVQGDSRRNTARARRYDVFALMYFHPTPRLSEAAYDAVRRLQRDMAILHRTEGASDAIRTCTVGGSWMTEGMSLKRVEAALKIRGAYDGMRRLWTRRLICALCEHEVIRGQPPDWLAITLQITGEISRAKRGERVRDACDDLASSYRDIDNNPRGGHLGYWPSLAFANA